MTRKVRVLLYTLFAVIVAAVTFAIISANRVRLLETVVDKTQQDSAQLIVDLEEKEHDRKHSSRLFVKNLSVERKKRLFRVAFWMG